MSRMILLSALIAVAAIGVAVPTYSQEQMEQQAAIVEPVVGQIASIDIDKAVVAVKQSKPVENDVEVYENVNVEIMPDTKILREDTVLSLSDLKVGDGIIVQYTVDEAGNPMVSTVTVE